MKSQTNAIFTGMKILTWIVFIGLCMKTGVLLFTSIVSLFVNPLGSEDLYVGLNLSALLAKNKWYFACITSLIIFTTGMRAYLSYKVIKVFLELNLIHPFSKTIEFYITQISYTALAIGIINYTARTFSKGLEKQGIDLSMVYEYFEGASEFIFFAGVIYIIALVYRKGIELQNENELTV